MPESPIVDVRTTIKVSSELISIFPDPSAVDDHFGDTPIYAAIAMDHQDTHRGPGPSGGPSVQPQQHRQ